VPPEHFHTPLVRAFTLSVFWPCVLINDIVSLAKEIRADHPNIVTVLGAEHGGGLADGLLRTWELYERTVGLMLRLQASSATIPVPRWCAMRRRRRTGSRQRCTSR
jgi:hypothetical protein